MKAENCTNTTSLQECLEQLNAQQAQADAIAERMAEIDIQIAALTAERDNLFCTWEGLVGEPLEIVGELLSSELVRHEADEKRGIFHLKDGSRILRGIDRDWICQAAGGDRE